MSWIACAMAVALVLPTQAPAPPDSPITNYWVHLNDLLRAELAKPARRTDPNTALPPPRQLPFEAIAELRARDLVRAANEGLREARHRMRDRPAAEIERQALANIHFCLEYFPLLAQRDEDLQPLLYVMEDPRADPLFRIYLFERMSPGRAPVSLFGDFLQDRVRREPLATSRIMRTIGANLFEPGRPQAAAIAAWYAFELDLFNRWLRALPEVADHEAATGVAVSPASLRGGQDPTLTDASRAALARRLEVFTGMVDALAPHLDPANNRPPEVQAEVRRTVLRILTDLPLENPAPIRALLESPDAADAPAG